jgi:disease resistance protein RPS2
LGGAPLLEELYVKSCDKISVLLSFSSMRYLERLEKLHILNCKNLNEIVSQEESDSSEEKIVFPALQDLLLENLPNLNAFFKGPYNLDFPSLQKVDIQDCPNMELFSRGFCSTPQLKDISMEIKSMRSSYIHKNDMNANIQRFKAFVSLVLMYLNYIYCIFINFKIYPVHLNSFNIIILIVD